MRKFKNAFFKLVTLIFLCLVWNISYADERISLIKIVGLVQISSDMKNWVTIKKPQKIEVLQNEIWKYSSNLETHTVETHVYRLRKKIKDIFKDENFIVSHEDGYKI